MKRPVNDEKDTHLSCTDKHASQMKHSSCCWLLFLEKIIFHLTCGNLWAFQCLSASVCVHMYQHPKKCACKQNKSQQISWKRQRSGDVVKKLLIRHIGKGCAARTQRPWVKRHLLNQGFISINILIFFKQQSNKQAPVEAFRAAIQSRDVLCPHS